MSLLDFPIMFDDVEILRPSTWAESSKVIENLKTSEAGTDIIEVTRYDKLTISATFAVTSNWAKVFKAFSKQNIIEVKRYDVLEEGYEIREMRIRDFVCSRKKKSEFVQDFNGLYDISFTLQEI